MVTLLAQTVPAVPVEAFASGLLEFVGEAVALVLPFAAAITAFVIGVGMLRRWLGHRPATSLGSSPSSGISRSDDGTGRFYVNNTPGEDFDYDEYKRRKRRSGENPGYGNRTWRKNAPPGAV